MKLKTVGDLTVATVEFTSRVRCRGCNANTAMRDMLIVCSRIGRGANSSDPRQEDGGWPRSQCAAGLALDTLRHQLPGDL